MKREAAAPERHEARRRLYQEVVALLNGKHGQGADERSRR